MEFDGLTWRLVALDCELVQLSQIPFEKRVSCFREVPHLEVALDLDQNRDKLFVELSLLEYKCVQGR